ncbi:MAG: hypothetical protein JST52_11585, partial [Bacteroidetes bacterium]|nr:hypothetical protein [Bacteroidota bacterium]
MGSTAGTNNIGYYSSAFATLAAWKTANSNAFDQNSVSVDPMFAAPASGDFTPTNAMMNDLGTPIAGITTDINGVTRSLTTPDMGAYEFNVSACFGNPTAGTASVVGNITSACVGGQINLGLSGFTIGQGISIQWQKSQSGAGSWSAIANATSSNAIDTFQGATDYRAVITCANGGGQDISNTVTVALNPFYMCYCSPNTGITLQASPVNYITGVSIPPYTLSSGNAMGAGGYTQFNVASTVSLMQGMSYTVNATQSTTYGVEMWVDWDQSGTFDSVEYYLLSSANPATKNFTVPLSAMPGITGLRVRSYVTTAFGPSGACANTSAGRETEDYFITVTANVPCTGTPTAGTAATNVDTLCVSGSVALSLTGYTNNVLGIQIQWQSSPAGMNSFSNISGATTDTFTVNNVSTPTDFRAIVTCTASSGVAYSNVKTVLIKNPSVAQTIPGTRCGTGNVTLLAVGANGSGIKWYDAATAGTLQGNGNAFTTPSLSTTTTYYAAAFTGGGTQGIIPMPAWGSNYAGNVRGFWFTSPVSMTITSLQSLATTTGTQSLAVVRFTGAVPPPAFSATTNAFTTLYLTQNNSNAGAIPVNISINAGDVIGIMGQIGGSCAYGTPAGVYTTTIAGQSVVLTRMGMQYALATTAPQDLWTEVSGAVGTVAITYTTGCEGTRVPVTATVNAAATGTGLAAGGTTVGNAQINGTTVAYTSSCNDTVAVINSGATNIGNTSAIVLTSPTVQTLGNKPFVPRAYDITPTTNGPATVTLYVLQSEFN